MRWRRLNKLIANVCGYFWLPCPLCGQMFGGHEWRDIDEKSGSIVTKVVMDHNTPIAHSTGICPECTRAGKGTTIDCKGEIV